VRERAVKHGITLDVDVDDRLGEYVGDERKIKQILLNLLSNAVKFTPREAESASRPTRQTMARRSRSVTQESVSPGRTTEDLRGVSASGFRLNATRQKEPGLG
jgi:nitrogen-specific signal transduction histidine kinase